MYKNQTLTVLLNWCECLLEWSGRTRNFGKINIKLSWEAEVSQRLC